LSAACKLIFIDTDLHPLVRRSAGGSILNPRVVGSSI